MALSGNKGEWSEIYTLLKVIGDKQLYVGDSRLNKIAHLVFPIIKVLREESHGTYAFSYEDDLVVINRNNETCRLPIVSFQKQAAQLLAKLKQSTSRTFAIPAIERFINSFHCKSLKANSSTKRDISIMVHDHRTGTTSTLGFSIKSQLGGPSTLLNAGKTTNFIYKITGENLTTDRIKAINAIETRHKIKDRMQAIRACSGQFHFIKTAHSVFGNNLTLIDSDLPKILAAMLQKFFTSSLSKTTDLVHNIAMCNPLDYNLANNHPFYTCKIKRFLTDVALGMTPSKTWNGKLDATGGYLIVKNDGEIRCYHIYNRNDFEDYLLHNTKLETASSARHDFGVIYQHKGGENFFKLNLQIRFIT